MSNEKVVGNARFKDGKLVKPKKPDNDTKFRNGYYNYKQKYSKTSIKSYSSYQQNQTNNNTDNIEEKHDLSKWKKDNQDDWLKLRQKIEENRKQK